MSRTTRKTDNAKWYTWKKHRKMLAYGARSHEYPGDNTVIKKVARQKAKKQIEEELEQDE